MPKLIRVKCPQCSGPLRIDPGVTSVTCEYCQHVSLIERPDRPVQRTAATMSFGTIDVEAARRRQRVLVAVILSMSLLPIVLVATCVLVATFGGARQVARVTFTSGGRRVVVHNEHAEAMRKAMAALKAAGEQARQAQQQTAEADRAAGDAVTKALAKMQKHFGGVLSPTPIQAADLTRVDGAALLAQARAVAHKSTTAQLRLSQVYFPRLTNGTIDVAGGAAAHFTFVYDYRDPTRRPGEDQMRGRVLIVAGKSGLRAIHQRGRFGGERPFAAPRCTTAQVWAAAVRGGVPQNAVARLDYDRRGFRGRPRWVVQVDGHREHRREIDESRCLR